MGWNSKYGTPRPGIGRRNGGNRIDYFNAKYGLVPTTGGTSNMAGPNVPYNNSKRASEGLLGEWWCDASRGTDILDRSVGTPDTSMSLVGGEWLIDEDHSDRYYLELSGGGQGTNENPTELYDYIAGANAPTNKGITLEAWIKPANITQDAPARILNYSDPDAPNYARNFLLGQDEAKVAIRLRTSNGSDPNNGKPYLLTGNVLVADTLTHVLFTAEVTDVGGEDKLQYKIYIDGDLSVSEDYTLASNVDAINLFNNWASNYKLTLGDEYNAPDEDRQWYGGIYLATVYNRALTPGEVYNNFKSGVVTNTVMPAPSTGFEDLTSSAWADNTRHAVDFSISGYRSSSMQVGYNVSSSTADFEVTTNNPLNVGSNTYTKTIRLIPSAGHYNPADATIDITLSSASLGTIASGTAKTHTISLSSTHITPDATFPVSAESVNKDVDSYDVKVQLSRMYASGVTLTLNASAANTTDYYILSSDTDLSGTRVSIDGGATVDVVLDSLKEQPTFTVSAKEDGWISETSVEISAISGVTEGGSAVTVTHPFSAITLSAPAWNNYVSHNEITWTFSESLQTGQYITGDWWVKVPDGGTVTVETITPVPGYATVNDDTGQNNYRYINGSVVNPGDTFNNGTHGIDDDIGQQTTFDINEAISLPLVLSPGDSLCSFKSALTTAQDVLYYSTSWKYTKLERMSVLTVVDEIPSTSAFRPPYAYSPAEYAQKGLFNNKKPTFDYNDIDTTVISALPATSGTVYKGSGTKYDGSSQAALDYHARIWERPWLLLMKGSVGRPTHPVRNMGNYHREIYRAYGDAVALLMCDEFTWEQKKSLLVGFVQMGIDSGCIALHKTYIDSSNGKIGPLLAGVFLQEPALSSFNGGLNKVNYRDTQCFYMKDSNFKVTENTLPDSSLGFNSLLELSTWTGATVSWRQNNDADHEHELFKPNGLSGIDSNWPAGAEWQRFDGDGLGNGESQMPEKPCPGNTNKIDDTNKKGRDREEYRRINSHTWPSMQLMVYNIASGVGIDASTVWGHPQGRNSAWLDYVDRWMEETWAPYEDILDTVFSAQGGIGYAPTPGSTQSSFSGAQWRQSRSEYPQTGCWDCSSHQV